MHLADRESRLEWQAVALFFNKSWFRRAWVLQEAAAKPIERNHTTVFCGRQTIILDWLETVARLVTWAKARDLLTDHTDLTNAVVNVMPLLAFASYRNSAEKLSLHGFMLLGAITAFTDPRDPLASMLPFAADVNTPGNEFVVDYAKSVDEAYIKFVIWYLNEYGCLDFPGWCTPLDQRTEKSLPAWVPDWRDWPSPTHNVFTRLDINARRPLYRTFIPMSRVAQPLQLKDLPQALSVSGCRISQVSVVSEHCTSYMEQLLSTDEHNQLCGLSNAEALSRTMCWDQHSTTEYERSIYQRGAFIQLSGTSAEAAPKCEWSQGLVEVTKTWEPEQEVLFTFGGSGGADVIGVSQRPIQPGDEL